MSNESSNISAVAKKLQIKPGKCWLFYNSPANYLAILEPMPDGVKAEFNPEGSFDGVQLFVTDSVGLNAELKVITPLLRPDTIFWITYPKKSSGIRSDLEMMRSWDELTKYGLGGVAAVSIDETWTALRFKPIEQTKTSEFCNEELKGNEHSAYIDITNKQVTLPPDMKEVLEQTPAALEFYHGLSYSNRKEYVVWILSAKQEKTKAERLEKLVDKLLNKKKNPAEK